MKKTLLITIFIIIANMIFAKSVPESMAVKVAKNYYFQALKSTSINKQLKLEDINLTCIQNPETD